MDTDHGLYIRRCDGQREGGVREWEEEGKEGTSAIVSVIKIKKRKN